MKKEELLKNLNSITTQDIENFIDSDVKEKFFESFYNNCDYNKGYKIFVTEKGKFFITDLVNVNTISVDQLTNKEFLLFTLDGKKELYNICNNNIFIDMKEEDYNLVLNELNKIYHTNFKNIYKFLDNEDYEFDLDLVIETCLPNLYKEEKDAIISYYFDSMLNTFFYNIDETLQSLIYSIETAR